MANHGSAAHADLCELLAAKDALAGFNTNVLDMPIQRVDGLSLPLIIVQNGDEIAVPVATPSISDFFVAACIYDNAIGDGEEWGAEVFADVDAVV